MKRLLSLLLFFALPSANAADLAAVQTALNIISDFADKLCKTPPLGGGTKGVELSLSSKAELNEVLKKVANLGVEGAAKYQSDQYRGVLQKDLANVLRDSSNCRLEVWRDLKDKLLPREPTSSPPASGTLPQPDDVIEQRALIEKVKKAEEENHQLKEVTRLANATAEAEAALREFSVRNKLPVIAASPSQVRTLAVLFRENATAEEIDAYMELLVGGVGLVIGEERAGSLRRLRSILDAAAQVAVDRNVGTAIQGKTRKERIRSFADLARSWPRSLDDQEVGDLRRKALRYPSLTLN